MNWIYDDGGRIAAGLKSHHLQKRPAGDCVIRSIAIVAEYDYKVLRLTCNEIVRQAGHCGLFNSSIGYPRYVYGRLLRHYGFRYFSTYRTGISRVRQFADRVAFPHNYILNCPQHMTSIMEGELHDIWDCSAMRVYGYWRKYWPVSEEDERIMRNGILY